MQKILIADDDENIAALISDNLTDEGYETVVCRDGAEALAALSGGEQFSLVLLDVMMPEADGLEVLKRVRDTRRCPIILVTAKTRTLDALLGLELGADDYIKKPFVVEELVAKVKAHIRRDARAESDRSEPLTFGEFIINPDSFELFKNGVRIELTNREFKLLLYLYKNRGRVLTREQIFDDVWGMDYFDMGSVTVTIKSLRDKIDPDNRYISRRSGALGINWLRGIYREFEAKNPPPCSGAVCT